MTTRIQTQWGYDVIIDDATTVLPAFITPADIAQASGGRISAADPRLQPECDAVSAAIRDYCGWHVAPILECETETQVDTRVIMLPAKMVTAIQSIQVNEEAISPDSYEHKRNGLVRMGKHPKMQGKWGAYTIRYFAGLDPSITSIRAIALQIAMNDLAATPGVRNESVGQVSISYNQATDGVAGGVSLMERDKAMLETYRIRARA